jgi:hypothetical protein
VDVELQFWMGMDVAAPLGDIRVELGDAIDDRHGRLSLGLAGNRKIEPAEIATGPLRRQPPKEGDALTATSPG